MLADKLNKSNKVLKSGALALGFFLAGVAGARDLGVQGKTWDITEIDMRQLIMESAIRANFSQYNKAREESAKSYITNLPKRVMAVTDRTETRWIDPSIEIASDIQGAELDSATKEFKWKPMFRKGTRANPLTVHQPLTAMLFFDGKSDEQLAFVKKILGEDRYGRVALVEATGADVGKLSKALGRPVFYLNDAMMQRFSLTTVPSLLYPGKENREGYLGYTVFAKPYQISALKSAWEMDVTKARGPLNGAKNADIR